MKKLLLVLVLAVMCSSATRADDFDDGYAAYNKGNYTQALELFHPLATQGLAEAQYNLGLMYVCKRSWCRAARHLELARTKGKLESALSISSMLPSAYYLYNAASVPGIHLPTTLTRHSKFVL